jgi:hypothetical protein
MQEEFTIKRVVPLMLKVSDIQPYDVNNKIYPYDVVVENNIGTISKCVSNVTWNVNLEELLGDLYDQYDYFNLELIQFMTVPMTGGNFSTSKPFYSGVNLSYRNLNIFVSGLQFVRSTFNQKTGNENRTAHIGNLFNTYIASTNAGPYIFLRGDRYAYSGQTGYMNFNLCFKKNLM